MSVIEMREEEVSPPAPPDLETAEAGNDDTDADVDDVEESLIEEISIDGMCGVY
jgi:mycofactocin precursor